MPITPSHNQAHEVTAPRVAAGVAWLDLHQPGWRERVDLDRLDMSCGTCSPADPSQRGCVAAQLGILGSYNHFVRTNSDAGDPEDLTETEAVHAWAVEHGLDLPAAHGFTDDAAAWAVLTAAWREALGPTEKEPATADPTLESPLEGVASIRIARGISVLDQHLPGWRERVDPDRLDMESGLFDPAATGHDERRCGCVLSQLNADPDTNTIGDYYHQLDVVRAMADPDGRVPDDRWAAGHGFDLETAAYPTDADEAVAYRQLTAEWHQALTAGQGADPVVGGWSA